jgi:hypothetical protein
MSGQNAVSLASLDEDLRRSLWLTCRAVPGLNAERWRYDHADLLMKWDEYGNRGSKVGWQLSYIVTPADGGEDHIDNLRAVSFALPGAEDEGSAT